MNRLVLITFLFLFGCKDYSQYKRIEHRVTIVPNKSDISSAEIAKWRVGPLRRQEVSKGIRIKLTMPQLEKEHMQDLVKNMAIDSWLIRVRRRTLVTNEILNYLYIPLVVPGRGTSKFRIKQLEAAFINIYYSAAAISTRFEKFQCPAFNHDKVVTDFEVVELSLQEKSLRGNKRIPSYFSGKLDKYSYKPYPINAGKDLLGEFRFEIALFNKAEKLRKSNWFELHEAVKITGEKSVPLKGCDNFQIPKNDSSIDNIQDFKFGR